MSTRYSIYRLIILVFVLALTSSCERLNDSAFGSFYHNVTARYNIYFNANEIYKEIVSSTEESHVDNYNTILDIYQFGSEASMKSNSSSVDQIIKKCTKIFDKHKDSRWVDDSYLLIAKGYFYKADYFAALETFQYVRAKYKNTKLAYEAMIWIALSNIQLQKYDDAVAMVTRLKSDKSFPESLKTQLLLTDAYSDVLTEDYISAIKSLEDALPKVKDREKKTRYEFILAQLYQATDQKQKAQFYYEEVIKRNPPYEMAFNAKIEIARLYEINNERDAREIKNLLAKMLKDDKNIQYLDQIYFEMALIDLKAGNIEEAEKNLKLCIKYSKSNDNQKAIAYLKLAQYYYEEEDYELSNAYFDSTNMFLTSDYPGYKDLIASNEAIVDLVEKYVLIETEDSLQYLATIPPKSRDSIIDLAYKEEQRLEAEQKRKEKEKQIREQQEMQFNRNQMRNRVMMPPGMEGGVGSGNWYFYNQSAISMGKSEFAVKWGKRKNEDNWRRKNSVGSISSTETDTTQTDDEEEIVEAKLTEDDKKLIAEKLKNIPKEKQKFYTDIPFTASQMKASETREMLAWKKIAEIYAERLYDTTKAIEAYEQLISKFPESRYRPMAHYYLYKFYDTETQPQKKQMNKDSILVNYPESDYAFLVKDPDYLANQYKTQTKELTQKYDVAYEHYESNNCSSLKETYNALREKYPAHPMIEKFAYLSLICEGKTKEPETFAASLETFKTTTSNADLIAHADLLIEYLTADPEEEAAKEEKTKEVDSFLATTSFLQNESATHYFMFVFETRKVNSGNLKVAFSDYNAEYFELDELKTTTFVFDDTYQILVVRDFENKMKAGKYMNGLLDDDDFLVTIKNRNPDFSIISKENFQILLREQDMAQYKEFFKRYY